MADQLPLAAIYAIGGLSFLVTVMLGIIGFLMNNKVKALDKRDDAQQQDIEGVRAKQHEEELNRTKEYGEMKAIIQTGQANVTYAINSLRANVDEQKVVVSREIGDIKADIAHIIRKVDELRSKP